MQMDRYAKNSRHLLNTDMLRTELLCFGVLLQAKAPS